MRIAKQLISMALVSGIIFGCVWVLDTYFEYERQKVTEANLNLQTEVTELQNRIQKLSNTTEIAEFPEDYLWSAEDQTSAELELQDFIVQTAQKHEILLTNFGSVSSDVETHSDSIAFNLEFYSKLEQFYRFLAEIENGGQGIAIGSLSVRNHAGHNSSEEVFVRLTVWALADFGGAS